MRFNWHLIKRSIRFWWQRRTRGWDDSETWSLEHSLAKLIAPRLKRFKELNNGVPGYLCPGGGSTTNYGNKIDKAAAKWDAMLDDMIFAFEFVADEDKYFTAKPDSPEWKRVEKGLTLFRKNFHSLWW